MAIGAFGKKYFVPYEGQGGSKREIQIFANGYSAPPIEWKGGSKPWIIEKGAADDLFDGLIVSSVATIEVLLEERFDFTEFLTSRQSHLVNLVNTDTDEIMWSGWVEPHDGNSPYSKPPHLMVFKASCGLAQLKRIKWTQAVTEVVRKPTIEIVRRCLFLTGHSLNLNTSVFATEEVMPPGDPLAGYRINTDRYYDGTVRLYAYDILADILEKHNSEIFQERNEWVIRSLPDQARGYTSKRRYTPDGSSLGTVAQELDYRINTNQAVSLSTGNRSALRPIKKWSASANLLPYTNPFQNGDLRNWDGTTFPGWNLAPMEGNWSKFDTGNPKTPFAIKITGFTAVQDLVKHKRNFWGRVKTTPQEPAKYIESAQLVFNPQEEKTTITIPYRLEARIDPAELSLIVAVWTERENGADRIWLQEDGKWGSGWTVIPFKGGSSQIDKEPTEARLEVDTRTLNAVKNWVPSSQLPPPYKILRVRIYQVIGWGGYPGVDMLELKIYGIYVNKTDTTFTGPTTVGYTINANSTVEDDSRAVQLLTAEVHGNHLTGITLDLNNDINTARWSRPGFVDERRSLLGLMIFERIALTSPPLKVIAVEIKVLPEQPDLLYENFLIFNDAGEERFKIVRYQYIEHSRTAKITAVELKYLVPADLTGMSQIGDQTSFDNNGTGEVSEVVESTTGTGTKPVEDDLEGEKVVLDTENITVEFIVAEENEEDIDILDILGIEIEDLEGLTFDVISKPTWLNIEMGDDGVWILSGIPPQSGSFTAMYTVTDEFEDISTGKIIITVKPSEDFAETWPPVFTDLPDMYFTIGKESTAEILLTDYMDEEHALAKGYSFRIFGSPAWVSEHTVIFMNLAVTGKPTTLEARQILVEIKDSIGRKDLITINLVVLPVPKHTYTIMDTDLVSIVGEVPGSYELPAKWDFRSKVEGKHDRIVRTLKGGGPLSDELDISKDEEVTETDLATYRMFQDTGGVITEAGQFTYTEEVYLGSALVSSNTVDFVLYDEEYLAKLKAFLTVASVSVGEINPDGSTVFDNYENWNPVFELTDVEHDEVILTMGEHTRTYSLEESALSGIYSLFEEDQEFQSGVYSVGLITKLAGVEVLKRTYKFEISAADPKPDAGFELISYKPGTSNYTVVGDLPATNGFLELPDAYGVMFVPDIEISSFEWKYYKLDDGGFTEVDIESLTGYPQKITFSEPVVNEKILIFGGKKSTQITDIHEVGRFRADGIARDASGKILQLVKADWTFREKLAPGDYSGLEFWNVAESGSTQIDPDMPSTGATYEIPVLPKYWSVRFHEFKSGATFDRLTMTLKRNGVILGHRGPLDEFMAYDEYDEPINNAVDNYPYVWGTATGGDGKRKLFIFPTTATGNIDEPDVYEVIVKGYLNDVLIDETSSIFNLVAPLPEPEIKDCCSEGGGPLLWNGGFDPEW
ncbi:hypothetical protein [Dyadobacter sp. CY312]|uniref:hypothetical protein n=1 Tax=Dyadobacter sp. CY312 TaxID=2907303 RepID=UPI001F276562|nr:hypothetical protein [Dyadobacter sp. CY312]MCE7038996.1 hypothetical protein [Dyadobacter sp. CY312]